MSHSIFNLCYLSLLRFTNTSETTYCKYYVDIVFLHLNKIKIIDNFFYFSLHKKRSKSKYTIQIFFYNLFITILYILAVFIGGLRVEMEDSAYKCPKEGCNKNFRKENLLQMHIKHYHPEYSKFLGSTPKVEDLAYARTIGESIEDIIPKKSTTFLEKINKFGKKKSLSEKSSSALLHSTLNTVQPASPSISSAVMPEAEEEDHSEKCSDPQKEDMKIETMSPMSSYSAEIDEDMEKKRENTCALSPGTLFDMKVKEEKAPGGIKTLLPVRPAVASEAQRIDRTKSFDDTTVHVERKGQKRRLAETSVEMPAKGKKRHGKHISQLITVFIF